MDDNSVYRDLFFEETDEYLQTLNECLLELEKNPEDTRVLDEMFRSAHTLKGMAATMGYQTMTDLTHRMESVMELYRDGTRIIDSETVSLIFTCLDKLSEIVEDLRAENEGNIDIEELLIELSKVVDGSSKREALIVDGPILQSEISETDALVIRNAQEDKFNAYDILVTLDKGCLLKGARSYLVINKLEQQGEIIHTNPNVEKLEEGDFENSFRLTYLSKSDENNIKETIEGIAEIESVSMERIVLPTNISSEIQNKSKEEKEKDVIIEKEEKPKDILLKNEVENNKVEAKSNNHHVNQSVRVDIGKLDNFMNLVSELVIYRTRLEDLSGKTQGSEIKEPLEHVARITSELQDLVLKIRMEPVNVVFNRFPRMIRDLSKELDKEINLIIEGEDTELDRTVVSELGEPLIHLIRNAADHGIETASIREAQGKPKEGTIKLSAYQEGNRVVITVSDDGKGMDPVAIKESAERKGIETHGMSDRDLIQLIFNQGFSTAKEVTNVSGRGVGMDVVRQKISSLGGTIDVVSEINKGTSFIIKLPLTLSIIEALMVKVGGETFAIPLGIIEKVVKVEKDEILQSHQDEVYMYRGIAVPVVRINEKLSIDEIQSEKHLILILLGNKYYALLVDLLIGQQEIVIKKLTGILGKMNEYLGATILGNGDITLILDVGNLCSERMVG